jgi:hypothetical protein
MRNDPNELPIPSEGENPNHYPADELRERAERTATRAFPHVEAICSLMARLRAAETRTNRQMPLPVEWFYNAPKLSVADENFDIIHERPWDHTAHSLEEAAEIAQRFGGLVFVEQDLYTPTFPTPEEGWFDEGFSVEVWPRFRVRP